MCPGQGPTEYTEEHLRGADVEIVRQHPGMFIGSTDSRGLHELLFNLVTDLLNEMARAQGSALSVILHADHSIEIADDRNSVFEEPSLESIFTQLYGHGPDTDGRYRGAYLTANALSAELNVRVRTDGSVYQHTFRRGVTHAVLQSGGPPNDRGLTIRFRPDPLIFGELQFDSEMIRDMLRQHAFLHSGVRISFTDESGGAHDEFEFADGIRAYVQLLNTTRTPIHTDVIVIRGEQASIDYEAGLQWCEEDEICTSFANDYYLPTGGTHVHGTRTGVTKAINHFIRTRMVGERPVKGDDARAGLTAIVSVRLEAPIFISAARTNLGNPEAELVLASRVEQELLRHFEVNPEVAERVVRRAILERNLREAAHTARKSLRLKKRPQ